MAAAEATQTGGLAAGVRWDLSDLYAGPDDPRIEADLAQAQAAARRFAERHRGGVARLSRRRARPSRSRSSRRSASSPPAPRATRSCSSPPTRPCRATGRCCSACRSARARSATRSSSSSSNGWGSTTRPPARCSRPRRWRRAGISSPRMRRYRPHVLAENEEKLIEDLANTGRRAFSRLFDEMLAALRFQADARRRDARARRGRGALAAVRARARAAARGGARADAGPARRTPGRSRSSSTRSSRTRPSTIACAASRRPLASRHLANEIDAASVDALLAACSSRYALVARYYRLKARLLGLPQLDDYDRYAPIAEKGNTRSWDEARALVEAAYRRLLARAGRRHRRLLRAALDRRRAAPGQARRRLLRVDAAERASLHPDELHRQAARRDDAGARAGPRPAPVPVAPRGLFEQDTPLTTAEMASVFGEMLTFRRLLRRSRIPRSGSRCCAARSRTPSPRSSARWC